MALIDDINALLPDNQTGEITPADLRAVMSMLLENPGFVGPQGEQGDPGQAGANGQDGDDGADGADANILDAWPVGSVFIGVVTTSPATLLGGGTWARVAEGRMLVSQSAGDANFDVARETGGAKTATLTTNELPAHTHTLPVGATDDTSAPFDRADAGSNASGANASTSSGSAGSGAAFSIMNPWYVVYMWERTA